MNKKLRNYAIMAMLVALATVLTAYRIPLAFLPPFYKLDFSEVVIILGGCLMGPWSTVIMQVLNVVLMMVTQGSNSAFVGDLANLIMGNDFVRPVAWYYHRKPGSRNLLIGLGLGIVSLIVVSCLVNYFILLPMYAGMYHMSIEDIVAMGTALNANITSLFSFVALATAPFNLIKGLSNAVVVYLIYRTAHQLFNSLENQ
ncbi:MAG: ECF transporter S component [Erysipelotrichaceae bacterium]|nr:ECF transporter S component [Erysipelotrichaceae bacterium]